LSAAICRLLADPELRGRLEEGGRCLVDPMYRAETMVEQIADIYRRVLVEHAEGVRKFDRTPSLRRRPKSAAPAPVNGSGELPQALVVQPTSSALNCPQRARLIF
jgi:hypothetical protein